MYWFQQFLTQVETPSFCIDFRIIQKRRRLASIHDEVRYFAFEIQPLLFIHYVVAPIATEIWCTCVYDIQLEQRQCHTNSGDTRARTGQCEGNIWLSSYSFDVFPRRCVQSLLQLELLYMNIHTTSLAEFCGWVHRTEVFSRSHDRYVLPRRHYSVQQRCNDDLIQDLYLVCYSTLSMWLHHTVNALVRTYRLQNVYKKLVLGFEECWPQIF